MMKYWMRRAAEPKNPEVQGDRAAAIRRCAEIARDRETTYKESVASLPMTPDMELLIHVRCHCAGAAGLIARLIRYEFPEAFQEEPKTMTTGGA